MPGLNVQNLTQYWPSHKNYKFPQTTKIKNSYDSDLLLILHTAKSTIVEAQVHIAAEALSSIILA